MKVNILWYVGGMLAILLNDLISSTSSKRMHCFLNRGIFKFGGLKFITFWSLQYEKEYKIIIKNYVQNDYLK